MYTQVEKPSENKSRAVANDVAQKKGNLTQNHRILDSRYESTAQRNIQNAIDGSSIVSQRIAYQPSQNLINGILQKRGRNHSDRVYKVTVSAQWMVDGELHIEPSESYSYPYTSDDDPTAPLERQAKRDYRRDHPNVPDGGPQMRMNVNGRALQG